MDPIFIPDTFTKATLYDLSDAILSCWSGVAPGVEPTVDVRSVLLAQWTIETGGGSFMHCWNIGNIKGVIGGGDGRSWTVFSCNEYLNLESAEALRGKARPRCDGKAGFDVDITMPLKKNSEGKVEVWFHPNHAGCCFRAYSSLEEGVLDYLNELKAKFSGAWAFALSGNPEQFSKALKAFHYYTATEAAYTYALRHNFDIIRNRLGSVGNINPKDTLRELNYDVTNYTAAVRAFQKKEGLDDDGIVGPNTLKKLKEAKERYEAEKSKNEGS